MVIMVKYTCLDCQKCIRLVENILTKRKIKFCSFCGKTNLREVSRYEFVPRIMERKL